MRFPGALLEGRLLRRYKRFLADIDLNGETVVCHCPNPGSMRSCAVEGGRVWVSKSSNPKRKLAYTWELAEVDGAMVCVNTMMGNPLVEEALRGGVVTELTGFRGLRREVPVGQSRIDFLLEGAETQTLVEVKSVTLMLGKHTGAFPDSVTKRGTRHLEELMTALRTGLSAALFFCVVRDDAEVVQPAREIDPLYAATLRRAADAGVQLLAYGAEISPQEITLKRRLPVDLGPG